MNADKEKLLKKIQALLNKGDTSRGATEEEAQIFMAKAKELMTKHGIEEMELEDILGDGSTPGIQVGQENADLGKTKGLVDIYISNILQKCFDVRVLVSEYFCKEHRNHKRRFILIGDALDTAVARMAVPLLHKIMLTSYRQHLRDTGNKGTSKREHSFYQGLVHGYVRCSKQGQELAEKVLSKEQKERYGLILVNKHEAISVYMSEKYPKLRKAYRDRKDNGTDHEAWHSGKTTGETMDILSNNKIE